MEDDKLQKTLAALRKGAESLKGHFKAAAAHHEAMAEAHKAMAKRHEAHASFVAAKKDSMDDGAVDKAYYGKVADLHTAKAAHHNAMAKAHEDQAASLHKSEEIDFTSDIPANANATTDGTPGAIANSNQIGEPGKAAGAAGLDEKMSDLVDRIAAKAFANIESNPELEKMLSERLIEKFTEKIGKTVEPIPGLRLVPPTNSETDLTKGLTGVPRPGSAPFQKAQDPAETVSPELAAMVSNE